MSSRRRNAGNVYAAGPLSRDGASRDLELRPLPPDSLTFSEPLEPIYLKDAPLNVGALLLNLLLMLCLSAVFLVAAIASSVIQFP